MQETQEKRVRSLGQEEPLEKEMATHSSVLAWRTLRREEPGGLYPQGHVESDWAFKPASASKQYEKPLEGTKEKTDMIWAVLKSLLRLLCGKDGHGRSRHPLGGGYSHPHPEAGGRDEGSDDTGTQPRNSQTQESVSLSILEGK